MTRQDTVPAGPAVRLDAWSPLDYDLLRAANVPAMTVHLGGPETPARLADRHRRYTAMSAGRPEAGRMYRILLPPGDVPVGTVGFWELTWDGEPVYETGWSVLPPYQGRGVATAATLALIDRIRAVRTEQSPRHLHAFPSVENAASNGVCRRAGFTLRGVRLFEYPPGHLARSHDWRFDLTPAPNGQARDGQAPDGQAPDVRAPDGRAQDGQDPDRQDPGDDRAPAPPK
ncbi:GNAT family N-acetyltransferase [Streptomyces sp. TRM64462]|uniref:GNAT family N-acetyltransferase n=1 Tax=Streptomyces sp. TRM64462 TaxID=2741726 RepID=UPI0028165133|nr:GNAT family N-acetyltransferase [Streptomyces sp. TRM64462]